SDVGVFTPHQCILVWKLIVCSPKYFVSAVVRLTLFSLTVRKAAFSASLLGTGEGHVGPISTETTLIFGKILSNVGNAYNPYTGIFTAPVRGIYEFKLFVYNHATSSVSSGASLHKNGERLVTAYAHNDDRQHVSSSNSVIVLMEQGDVVFVRLWANRRIFDSKNHHSTFSGHILFPL
uniref:C1q domain-containing protein n=1 Tax=Pygocentrus nattereri TaxID=42514 RepID=A0AAR2LL55_PYGNA